MGLHFKLIGQNNQYSYTVDCWTNNPVIKFKFKHTSATNHFFYTHLKFYSCWPTLQKKCHSHVWPGPWWIRKKYPKFIIYEKLWNYIPWVRRFALSYIGIGQFARNVQGNQNLGWLAKLEKSGWKFISPSCM